MGDGDGQISEEELNDLMTDDASVKVLDALEVDLPFLQTLQLMTYKDVNAIPIAEILDQMLTCRRSLPLTVKHLILAHHLTIWMFSNKLLQHEKRMEKKFSFAILKLLNEISSRSHEINGRSPS